MLHVNFKCLIVALIIIFNIFNERYFYYIQLCCIFEKNAFLDVCPFWSYKTLINKEINKSLYVYMSRWFTIDACKKEKRN